jgi:hypothetical protein
MVAEEGTAVAVVIQEVSQLLPFHLTGPTRMMRSRSTEQDSIPMPVRIRLNLAGLSMAISEPGIAEFQTNGQACAM